MSGQRRMVELKFRRKDVAELEAISRSRTEAASRMDRARVLLAYRADPSFYAVSQTLGMSYQTVRRCIERAEEVGVMASLDDRPRPGKEPDITMEAKAWVVALACRKAKDLGYPHELWTTRLLASHARAHGPQAGHDCLGTLVQGTVCKILDAQEVKPHKVRYYLERRDPAFKAKMAQVLCVEFIEFLKLLDAAYPAHTAIRLILDNHSAHISKETKAWLATRPGRFEFTFTPTHGSWLNLIEGFFSKLARSVLRHIRVGSKQELKDRIMAAMDYCNQNPVVHTWSYKLNKAA
jgi:transposase